MAEFSNTSKKPLVFIVPIEPRNTGNGLAMRAGALCQAAARLYDVKVVVVPVSGTPPPVGRIEGLSTLVLPVSDILNKETVRRDELLADRIVRSVPLDHGSPIFVMRSYLSGVALGVAMRLKSRWIGLDLDDDDETFAVSIGDLRGARQIRETLSRVLPAFQIVTASSPFDAQAISRRYGKKVETLVNTVSIPVESTIRRDPDRSVMFIGNLTYPPNIDAVLRLVNDVLPELRRMPRGETSKALIVGPFDPRGPLRVLSGRDDVTLLGFVDDLDALYRRAGVVVIPMEIGSGTRIKVLEAFAHKVPVVSTPIGVTGIDVRDGRHILIRESPFEIARSVSDLFGNENLCHTLSSNAHALVLEQYSDIAISSAFSRICLEVEGLVGPTG
ncbi:MAG: glycosyltransferase family 4 protein [Actinomycetota bacterium]|nr:glycosyltransferase family 4 protein [Actinomycetota bacterium]